MDIEIVKTEVRETPRKLIGEWKLIDINDLSEEEYIEYMTDVFEEAKEWLPAGRVNVNDRGEISIIAYEVEEVLTKALLEEINVNI